jgi:hypothetical protein
MALPLDAAFGEYNLERMKGADAVLLGARSYLGFRNYWPTVEHDRSAPTYDREFSKLYDRIEKIVVSDHASLPEEGHPWAATTRILGAEERL